MYRGAWDRIRQEWLPVLFRGSPYAERMPIGKIEIIEEAPASRLEGFYKKWYRADNMALVFAGDFDGAALEASLKDHFLIEKPGIPTTQPLYDLPPPKRGIETLVLTDPELTSTNILLYFKRSPEAIRGDLLYFRNEIIDALIDSMLSLRFSDEIFKLETPYLYAGGGTSRHAATSRFYTMSAQAKTGSAEQSLEALLRMKESMRRYGFDDSELAIAKQSMVSNLENLVLEKDRHESENYVNMLVSWYLEGGSFAGLEWQLDAVRQLLPHINAKDINTIIKDYFASRDVKVFIFAPDAEKASLPGERRIRQMVSQSRRMRIPPPTTTMVEEGLLSGIPTRGAVITESVDEETGAILWDLSNGARVILKSTQNKNDEIIMQALARGGISSAAPEDDISASLATEMIQVSGLGPWSRPELTRKLAGKQVSFAQSVSTYNRSFQGSSTSGDLKTFFEILYLSFTDPRIDPEAVEAMMDRYASSLALRTEDPNAVFSDEIVRTVTGGHPRFKPMELSDLPWADIGKAMAFIDKALNPADYTFVFVGNLEATVMREYIETYLASIPPGEIPRWNSWTDLNVARPGKVEKNVYKGMEEQSTVLMAWFSETPFSEELSIAAQVLSEYLEIKMTDEIREKLGGVYSISSGVSFTPMPRGEFSMQVYFACDPKRVEELSGAVMDQLRFTANSIDRDIFNKAVEALKKEYEVSMQSNTYIARSYTNSSVIMNTPLSRLNRRPHYFDAVTPADIQGICARLLQNGPAQVVLLPER
jgi:zinc protease